MEVRKRPPAPSSNDGWPLVEDVSLPPKCSMKLSENETETGRRRLGWDDLAWLLAMPLVYWYLNVFEVLWGHTEIRRLCLLVALSCMAVFFAIGAYVVFYINNYRRLPENELSEKHPHLFPLATTACLFGSVMFIYATWPAWGLWGILVMVVSLVGSIVAVSFLP